MFWNPTLPTNLALAIGLLCNAREGRMVGEQGLEPRIRRL